MPEIGAARCRCTRWCVRPPGLLRGRHPALGPTRIEGARQGIIEAPQNLQTISDVVGQALGGSPRVRFVVLGAEHAQDAPEVAAAPAAQVTEDELVSRLTEEFDAHEV